ncbi:MAG: response regulator [Candidatus Sumerlaeaceae bacterium]|nr:response regulator [Candidatus Sumerlaeaceae bacterium]
MRILVVDDNPEALFVVERFLKTLGHEVFSYTDGREALLWLKEARPQVIIADLDMPEMDGYAFVKHVRAYNSYAATPIICITGTTATDEQIGSAGFASILRKPVTLSDVMEAIELVESGLKTAD